ncbi:hypothetical protein TCAL_01671 [Tigriopus californicus]|uniref:Rho-GAP domain-containing protein n=1 Tax=Tigriopus californicus TaxID=6832 RepID=A0A553PC37_TIGCA|nr:hypothetical protein TCAL_01671 [Tigriopus californicus]|eukprot:TCALIF_01671-PA protein Name:"Similar to RhoGAP100F Rho GTPase-activating protein 100F (Drosophila melanogaster)" AED:0.03 eAED:0.03 QI:207/0.87/0.55/1/1/1/9/290/1046
MLCCGREKDSGRDMKSAQNTPSRQPMNMPYPQQQKPHPQQPGLAPPPLSQPIRHPGLMPVAQMNNSFDDQGKKPSGISEEVFRQLETVQNRYDSTTAEAFRMVQKSGEMVVRTLDPRQFIRLASETAPKINIDTNDPDSVTTFVEIVKRPGQTLGLYIREGNGIDRTDGVFISRIAIDSAVYSSGCLQLGDEILAVNLVDVTRMSLDDVVIIMSIPRRLVLTTRRSRVRGYLGNGQNGGFVDSGKATPPVVVYKGDRNDLGTYHRGDYDTNPVDSPRGRDYMPYRDSRTLTWDRNPKPDRNDPKYFPVNSLPRQSVPPNGRPVGNGARPYVGNSVNEPYMPSGRAEDASVMPPPMRELNTGYPPMETRYISNSNDNGYGYTGPAVVAPDYNNYGAEDDPNLPGRGQRLLQRMGSDPSAHYSNSMGRHSVSSPSGGRRANTLQYPSRHQYSRGSLGSAQPRSRNYSGFDYASDTEALQSPGMSMRMSRTAGRGFPVSSTRSSSLPRTFQREALLRHPELSMEMDRLIPDPGNLSGLSTDDQLSDPGANSAPESIVTARRRGYRSPSSYSAMGAEAYQNRGGRSSSNALAVNPRREMRRTPSTSAIYETLRRSRELRETLSRPSSRLSFDNIPDKLRDPVADAQYYSDSEHHYTGATYGQRQELRRLRNRTISGLEHLRSSTDDPNIPSSRPSSAQDRYKSEAIPENGGVRLSGILNLHLLAGRGLRTGGRSRRIRDLYCVVEVDHIHKARTVVRSGGINFDWDERFELDMANNLEVEFLVYSWDPQLRHRLCYRASLRLATLFGKGQTFQQVALRLHPAGTLYLTLSFLPLTEAYDRARYQQAGQKLFGVDLETVLEQEANGYLVPTILKRCVDEIERRGLDIIGIYRLCGAETKKNMLRLAFEEAPETVDLSSENVPDINVITGLVKEYLRELPQPVFTNCLYQMLVDAMGVFLPHDPDGNAKLVFSILDCLPKANRNCLVHIMDHLARVTAQCTRNKMNPQNLAICFAPVLMLEMNDRNPAAVPNISEPIQILKYLIEIWPKTQE